MCPSRLGYLLDLAPKDLEKVIYFAAYMITSVDEDARHRDLSSLENKVGLERERLEKRRDGAIDDRTKKLEEDLATLEAEGAKADARRKVKRRRRARDEADPRPRRSASSTGSRRSGAPSSRSRSRTSWATRCSTAR